MKVIFAFACIVFLFPLSSHSQNQNNRWAIGVSGSLVSFGNVGLTVVRDRYNAQIPKINITRYLFSGLSLDAGFTVGTLKKIEGLYGNAFDYFSFDGGIRYDFNTSTENYVPYIGLGGSIVGAPATIANSKPTPTLNFSLGATYWISSKWGVNAQATYKYSQKEFQSMVSHVQLSAGLVYSFGRRAMVYRLWDVEW